MLAEPRDSDAVNRIPFAHPEALADPEKLLAAYFSSSTVGLAIFDPGLRFLAINKALAEMHGVPVADHLGRSVREVLGNFADRIEPEFQRVLATGEGVNFEISAQLLQPPEVRHWIAHYLPIKDKRGTVTRIGAVVVDLTAQKKLEESLKDSEERLRKEIERLRMVLDVSGILATNWDLQLVFPRISARIRRVLRQEYASFALHDVRTGLLVRQALDFPLSKGFASTLQISAGDSPSGRTLNERTPMIFSREQIREFDSEMAKGFLAEGLKSLCCVPLLRPKGPMGVFVLGSTRPQAFHAEDLATLNQVAEQLAVALENRRAAVEIEALKERLSEERKYLEGEIRTQGNFAEIIGESPTLERVLEQVTTVATSDATVLILGETGTGKELIARAIHRMSRRKDGSFIKVNCAAIPTGLLESELFGHERGAFTGAVTQKVGRMELADGGTLFLDEVGGFPLNCSPSYCACCKIRSSSDWAAIAPFELTCG